jgi:hypothetical protein
VEIIVTGYQFPVTGNTMSETYTTKPATGTR